MWQLIKERLRPLYKSVRNRNKTVELSFSRLQAYQRCPWLYHLVYDEGWRSGPTGNMALGLSLHKTLEQYLAPEQTRRSLEALMEIYDQMWVNEGYRTPQETLDVYDAGRKMLESFYESDSQRTSQTIGAEVTFSVDLKGVRFYGTIDRLDKTPNGWYEVVEYKTKANHWTPARINNDLQMTLYRWGVKEGLRLSPVRLKYIFLSNGEVVPAERTPKQEKEAVDLLFASARAIRNEKFDPNFEHCPKCEFAKRCTKFKGA